MKLQDIPEDIEPRVGDILEIEQGDVCFEVRIIGITADGYLCEQDNVQGAVLLEGVDLDHSDVTDITGYIAEEKVRLDPKCWKGKKIGNPKTKMKGGVRVNNCVPEGQEGIAEGRFDEPLTGWHIVYRNSGNPVHATPSFETKEQAQKYLMTKMFANHQDFKVVHTAGVGMAEGSDLPPKVIEMIKKIAQSSASPEHKKAAIDALVAKYSKKGVAEGYTGRETKDGTWRVFKDGKAVAVAGPFKSREEAADWIKKQKQGVAEGLGNKKVTIQGLKNWIAKAQAEGYEVEEVMKGEMWRAVNPKTGGLKGTFHTTGTPGRGSLWGSGPDGTPADSGTLVIKQGVAKGSLNPKKIAKAKMLKMYGDGNITFSKTSNNGYFIQHEDDFGDTNSHPYDPKTGKVDFRGSISSTYYGEGVAEGGWDGTHGWEKRNPLGSDRLPQDPMDRIDRMQAQTQELKQRSIERLLKKHPDWERSDLELASLPELIQMLRDDVNEAEYQGRKVPLGKPMAGDVAKSKVYVRKPNGKVVKVNFGDKDMKIKKSNPKRRKSFRARHNCQNPGPRWKARYWSCRAW